MAVKASDELTERLTRVERDIRVLKWMWLLLAVGLCLTQRFPFADSYSAQSYVLRNWEGQQVGRFAIDGNGMPVLELGIPNQNAAIRLRISPENQTSLTLNGPNQQPWSAP